MPFVYPTNYEMSTIEPELVQRAAAGRLGLKLMPTRNVNAAKVRWRQKDNYYGLQHFRGLDGQPTLVTRVGEKMYEFEPGIFGEYEMVTETELMIRAGSADLRTTPIDVGELVQEADEQLIGRELDRIESSIWSLLVTGTLTIKIAGPNGVQTGYSSTFPIQTFTASVAWGTYATATPLLDFFTVSQLGLGKGVGFGSNARAYMNSVTANKMLRNKNADDLNGRRAEFGSTYDALPQVNQLLVSRDAPVIEIYDEGYIPTENGSYTKFIPDDKVVVIGSRASGVRIGEYVLTRNIMNGGVPGSYRFLKDYANGINAEKRVPPSIEVHRGHNGGPALWYPSAVVVMNV